MFFVSILKFLGEILLDHIPVSVSLLGGSINVSHGLRRGEGVKDFVTTVLRPYYKKCYDGERAGGSKIA